jgi:cell division protein FtsQ
MARDDAHLQVDTRVAPRRVDLRRDEPLSLGDTEPEFSTDDPEDQEEQKFLRAQKRLPVRRGAIPRKAATRIKLAVVTLAIIGLLGTAYGMIYRFGTHSARFRVESSDDINIHGLHNVARSQVMDVLGGDLGRNVFFIPLDERKRQLEEIPWVESATLMRLLPDHLGIDVRERTPVAFVQTGSRIGLIDSHGVILDLPRSAKYSFPVVSGTTEAEPLATRSARMKIYGRLVESLDSEGAQYSKDLSEVDLTDPEDVKITVSDPHGAVLIHLGSEQFLERYKVYIAHAQEWQQQFHKLESVDLRFERQIIVNPDTGGTQVGHSPPVQRRRQ